MIDALIRARLVFWDFDGVIKESVAVKTEAFVQLFSPFGAEVAAALRIQYGGSVKPDNAEALFSQPDIDGGLIGGAALKSDSFLAICKAAAAAAGSA